jgi:hypothetical protein
MPSDHHQQHADTPLITAPTTSQPHHPSPVIPQPQDKTPSRYGTQEAGTAAPPFLFFAFAFRLVRSRGFSAAMPALHTSAYRA